MGAKSDAANNPRASSLSRHRSIVPGVSLIDKVKMVSATVVQRYPIVVVVEMASKWRLRITRATGDLEFPGNGIRISGRDLLNPSNPWRIAADRPATKQPG
jgi:hypothetical protein